jgi:hypothetical protein
MESNLSISPQDIHQTLVSNQISEINLKDGTILKVSNNFGPLKKKNGFVVRKIKMKMFNKIVKKLTTITVMAWGLSGNILKLNIVKYARIALRDLEL